LFGGGKNRRRSRGPCLIWGDASTRWLWGEGRGKKKRNFSNKDRGEKGNVSTGKKKKKKGGKKELCP